jgi:GT2 family glycosyltransferase
MLSIVMPVCNVEDATNECIANLIEYSADGDIQIIVVDNNSTVAYKNEYATVLRNNKNVGFWPAMLQGIARADNPYVLCMHNDVFIWEPGYDTRIVNAFEQDNKLGAVGFFGGRGVCNQGGRGYPESNMLGYKYGTHGRLHGNLLISSHPAVVFDSLAIAVRRGHLYSIDYETIPPHHWTDRMLCLRMITSGYRCLTVGIGFDHGGAFTSSGVTMNTFTEDWCKAHGLTLDGYENWDMCLYHYGLRMFQSELQHMLPSGATQLWVNANYDYSIR